MNRKSVLPEWAQELACTFRDLAEVVAPGDTEFKLEVIERLLEDLSTGDYAPTVKLLGQRITQTRAQQNNRGQETQAGGEMTREQFRNISDEVFAASLVSIGADPRSSDSDGAATGSRQGGNPFVDISDEVFMRSLG